MPRTKISEFSSTPANNTDIDSINIAEGCAPSNINDAIRELMAQLKDWQSGTSNDPYVVGSSGSLTLNQGTANGVAYLNGSKVVTSGSALTFDGTNFTVGASATTGDYKAFIQKAGGELLGLNASSGTLTRIAFGNATASFGSTQIIANASDLAFITNSAEQMRLTSTGLGIGTSSPASKLTVYGGEVQWGASSSLGFLGYTGGFPIIGSLGALPLAFYTNGSERARIDSSGRLIVGTTNAGYGLFGATQRVTVNPINDGIVVAPIGQNLSAYTTQADNDTGTRYALYIANGSSTPVGNISFTSSATAYNTSSDYRLKNTIAPMTGALAKVALLKPCTYKWNADGSDGQGFIAHELAEVVPQCVTGEKDAVDANGKIKPQSIDTSFLVATLTAALQEAHGLIKSLETRISALEAK